MVPSSNGNEAIIAAIERLSEVKALDIPLSGADGEEAHFIVVPSGKQVVDLAPMLDRYRTAPNRRKGTAALTTLDSFIAHVQRHHDADSVIFADVGHKSPQMVAVYDYNPAGPDNKSARFGQHRAVYRFQISDEWKAWTSCKEPMSQSLFAEFLEDRLIDVRDPAVVGDSTKRSAEDFGITLASPKRLLELSRGLAIRVGARVTQAVNLSTGEVQVGFEERHEGEGGGPLKVPSGFAIGVPVFRGGVRYQVLVRLRYRVKGGDIAWWFVPHNADTIWDHAVAEACDMAVAGTGLPLFYGAPEA